MQDDPPQDELDDLSNVLDDARTTPDNADG
jgi:hypothetical protein